MSEFVERRKQPRILFETFASYHVDLLGRRHECYIQNIGPGGAMVYAPQVYEVGQSITLSFPVGERTVTLSGVVRAARNFSETRRFVLHIGKSLDFHAVLHIAFDRVLEPEIFTQIRVAALS